VQTNVFSVDFETTGLNYLKMQPVGVSFCDGERTCYIDLWENKDYGRLHNYLATVFSSNMLFMAHHAKFDYKCCQKFLGRTPNNIFCSFIASFLLDENRDSHSLDSLAQGILGTTKTGKWEEFTDWHSPEFAEYCMVDSELCYRLWQIFQPELKKQNLEHVFQIEMDFIPVAAEIEMNGILVDQEALAELQALVEQRILDCEDKMLACVNLKPLINKGIFGQEFRKSPINFNSSQQLVKCFQKLGLELKEKTPKGEWSISKQTLDRLKGNEFVDLLLESKRLQKLYTSYIIPIWGMIDEDGRIRPDVGIVKTGRTSMANPNLQQLPNVKDKSINYRRIFTTTGVLCGADFSGQELRILGEITQDENIIQAFKKNLDLHLYTANHIFCLGLLESDLVDNTPGHMEASKRYKSERYRAKNGANFPIVYGSSAGGIAWRQGVTKDEAQRWVDGFFKAYPKVQTAMQNIPKKLLSEGSVSTLMGRKRRFPSYRTLPQFAKHKQPSKDKCVRQAFNFLIQGFAADQAKISGRKILDALKAHQEWDARILLIIHDEYVVEAKPEYVEEVKACVKHCMENAVSLSVPFVVECKTGKNYSEIK
jgi:DNA polymerase-1